MKRKAIALMLTLIFLLTLAPAAMAGEVDYVICGDAGSCDIYEDPDNGVVLGTMTNGTTVTFLPSRSKNGWIYLYGRTAAGNDVYGYVREGDAVPWYQYPYDSASPDPIFDPYKYRKEPGQISKIHITEDQCPDWYCYVYDTPDCINGTNIGRMNNGYSITGLGYVNNNQGGWYKISGYTNRGVAVTGYIHWYCAR